MEKISTKATVRFFNGKDIPLEMHKVKIVQSISLVPVERRLEAIREAGFNSFLLTTNDIFLDMLTDSGTNAQSDAQVSKMFIADEAYAGSQSFPGFRRAFFRFSERNMSCRRIRAVQRNIF